MFKELSKYLSSPARLKVLKFFSFQPAQRFAASDVSSTLGMSKKNAEAELRSLAKSGIITRKGQGKKVTYAYAADHPFAEPLRLFLAETTLPSEKSITAAFKGVPGVSLLIACGSLALDSRSPIDLLVVTRRPRHPSIERAVRKVEVAVALPLKYAVLEAGEYKSRLEANDRLLRDVFDFSHRQIMGRA